MTCARLAAAALGLLLLSAGARPTLAEDAGEGPSAVIEITSYEEYEAAIAEHKVMLLEFYAPWCGHCKKLGPEFEKAAKALSLQKSEIRLAKIDATVEGNAKATIINHVKSYPTMVVVVDGQLSEYQGEHDGLGIVETMQLQSLPVMTEITTVEDAMKFQEGIRVALVGAFVDSVGNAATGWAGMAEALRGEFAFGQVMSEASTEVHELFMLQKGIDGVGMWRQFDEGAIRYSGPDAGDALFTWARIHSSPIADRIAPGPKDPDRSWFRKLFWGNEDKQRQLVLCLPPDHGDDSPLVAAFKEALKQYRGRVRGAFAHSDFKELHEFWGVDAKNLPLLVLNDDAESARYQSKPGATLDVADISKFIQDAIEGNLKKTMKSGTLTPKSGTNVVEVVYDNFEEVVIDSEADVMLEIYAPWCGHCKALAPHYERIAHTFRGDDRLVVANFDGSINDLPKGIGEMDGYPKVMLFPAGKKDEPLTYSGKTRTFDTLVKWLQKESTAGSTLKETDATMSEQFGEFLNREFKVTGGQILVFFSVIFFGVLVLLFLFAEDSPPPRRITPKSSSNKKRK